MSSHQLNIGPKGLAYKSSSNVFDERNVDIPFIVGPPPKGGTIEEQRSNLVIASTKTQLFYCLENFQVIIIVGSTGCGKTTQVPQYLFEQGYCSPTQKLVCTQPRRIAAISVASRVAEEKKCPLGTTVGYCVRGDRRISDGMTSIVYATDGYLLKEALRSPLLSEYAVVMVDEAHERTVNTDVLVALLKKISLKRPELKIIVSSATLDASQWLNYFNTSTDISKQSSVLLPIEGRGFPVKIHTLTQATPDYISEMVNTVRLICDKEGPGDILCFLPGREEVIEVVQLLSTTINIKSIEILPLYASLPRTDQMKIFSRPGAGFHRRVVVATNIAEASVTIPNIVFVVDCGYVRIKVFNSQDGSSALVTVPESQSSAIQRAGRAGRVRSGKCYRLECSATSVDVNGSEKTVMPSSLHPLHTPPEITRSDFTPTLLFLKTLGVDNIASFVNFFLTPPPITLVAAAITTLCLHDVLDEGGSVTERGTVVSELLGSLRGRRAADGVVFGGSGEKAESVGGSTEIRLAVLLLNSLNDEYNCCEEALTLVAMLSVRDVFFTPHQNPSHYASVGNIDNAKRSFAVAEGDLVTMLNVFNAAQKHGFQKKWQEQRSIDSQKMEQVCAIRANLFALLKRMKLFRRQNEPASVETVQRCICSAFFQNMATRPPTHSGLVAQFVLLSQQPVEVHPSSFVFAYPPPMFVFVELLTNAQGRHYAHLVTQITEEWLLEVGSKYYEKKSVTEAIADEEQKQKERKERDRKKHEIEAKYQEERKKRAESGKFDAFSLFGDSEQIRDLF